MDEAALALAWSQALCDLRHKIINRCEEVNGAYASRAWERRYRDPISPHALIFFYAEPMYGDPPRCELRIAVRAWPAGDRYPLPRLLHEMTPIVTEHLAAGTQLETALFTEHEPRTAWARYVGLAVSTLDTPAGSWEQVRGRAGDDTEVPGRCLVFLQDGSRLLINRRSEQGLNITQAFSTHPVIDVSYQRPQRLPIQIVTDLAVDGPHGPGEPLVWVKLAELHAAMNGVPRGY